MILQKETPIGPDDTLGTVYFDRLFPMGVKAMLEAADLVIAGKHKEVVQDESQATYEGWCREAEARINWANHVDFVYNLIRGCNPAPGAWTTLDGEEATDLRRPQAPGAHLRRRQGQDRRSRRSRRRRAFRSRRRAGASKSCAPSSATARKSQPRSCSPAKRSGPE